MGTGIQNLIFLEVMHKHTDWTTAILDDCADYISGGTSSKSRAKKGSQEVASGRPQEPGVGLFVLKV
jgi:hypothetical protein